MERTGTLIREKYRENLISTLAMSGSVSIANIVDRIMVGNLLGSTELAGQSLTGPTLLWLAFSIAPILAITGTTAAGK